MDSLLSLLSGAMKGIPTTQEENPQTILTVIEELAPIFKRLLKDSKISFEGEPGTPLASKKRKPRESLGVGHCPRGSTGTVGTRGSKRERGCDGRGREGGGAVANVSPYNTGR